MKAYPVFPFDMQFLLTCLCNGIILSSGSLKKGADEEQMMEAIHVAAAIRGGSSLVHGVQMMNKANEILM